MLSGHIFGDIIHHGASIQKGACAPAAYVNACAMDKLKMKTIQAAIAEHIASEILPGSASGDVLQSSSLFEDGFVDSLGLQQILVHIEDEYSVEVEEDDLIPENFETVEGIAALVDRLLAA